MPRRSIQRGSGLALLLAVACFDPESDGPPGESTGATDPTTTTATTATTAATDGTTGTTMMPDTEGTTVTTASETGPDPSTTQGGCPTAVFGEAQFGEACFGP